MADSKEPRAAPTRTPLLVATTNAGKVSELAALLKGTPYLLQSPADLGINLEVEETGETFIENARLKARAHFEATGVMTVAEDSGLEINALGGRPGVHSARYEGLPDGPAKNARMLELLSGVPARRRGCRYRCAIVLIHPNGEERFFEGRCAGRIADAPSGENGFGFDPIFLIPRLGLTMAEVSDESKNRMSHRGRATHKLIRYLNTIRPVPSQKL